MSTTANQATRPETVDASSLPGFGLEDVPLQVSDKGGAVSANEIDYGQRQVAPQNRSPKAKRPNRHLTIGELCEDLGIARSTFYEWRTKHKAPPCFKLPNGDLRIRRADYEDWLTSLEEER